MNPALWTLIGVIVASALTYAGVRYTGRSATKTAQINAAEQSWTQVLPYWKATIEQLQERSQDQDEQITRQTARIKEQDLQITELQIEQRLNVTWKQAALAHILALHTYVRLHLHRDDIPAVPTELAADIPSFEQPPSPYQEQA